MKGSQSGPLITHLSTCHRAPKWSLPGKARDTQASRTAGIPGPGAYTSSSPEVNKYRRSPHFGFGTSPRAENSDRLGVPGPGQYNTDDATGANSLKAGFGTSTRMPLRNPGSPGPGAYEMGTTLGQGTPKYSSARRTNQVASGAGNTPGPGAYQPSFESSSNKARTSPRWGFGTSPRDNGKGDGVPGPGTYMEGGSLAGPKYSMGSKGEQKKQNGYPGPGAYGAAYTQFG